MVIDGNMKNHRMVCYATSAGYMEYDGLPGRIRTGCPRTPDFKSRYCMQHKPVAVTVQSENGTSEGEPGSSTSDEVALIVGKRTTRNSALYEVHIHAFNYLYDMYM